MKFDMICSALVAAAAVAMAATYASRVSAISLNTKREPSYEKEWMRMLDAGVRVGNRNAPVKIVEYGDFQCPFCGQFAPTIDSVRAQFRDKLEFVFVHLPISSHRYAASAARASECAAAFGRFDEFYHQVYLHQDSLGSWSWADFARKANIAEAKKIEECTNSSEAFPRIAQGPVMAKTFAVTGTPTIFVNGWRFYSHPSSAELSRVVESLVEGRAPFRTPGPVSWLRERIASR